MNKRGIPRINKEEITVTQSQYEELARRTLSAQKERREIPMITKDFPELTRQEGYYIQALRERIA